jgi:hypothetical protein
MFNKSATPPPPSDAHEQRFVAGVRHSWVAIVYYPSMRRLARLTDVIIVVALLAGAGPGCSAPATYSFEGPPLARLNVAQVWTGSAGEVVGWPSLVSVDGRPVSTRLDVVEVAPGRRELEVEVRWSNGFVDRTRLAFQADGGHQYAVIAREEPYPTAVLGEIVYEGAGRSVLGVFLIPFEVAKHYTPDKPPQRRPPRRCSLSILNRTTGKPAPIPNPPR